LIPAVNVVDPKREFVKGENQMYDGGQHPILRGVNLGDIERRINSSRVSPEPRTDIIPALNDIESFLTPDGNLAKILGNFEPRPQQLVMLQAVAKALCEDEHLIVEAGTGVGKSLAYLLPAAAHAIHNDTRVVISTNTIALQEQLLTKDLMTLKASLHKAGAPESESLNFIGLKGRGNYLCLNRLMRMLSRDALAMSETTLLRKLAPWLTETETGDRSEVKIEQDEIDVWNWLSAQSSPRCPSTAGPCFLRAARLRADESDIVVVNHALLLADLKRGGGLIPDYEYLIVDEAHHLEEEATKQFGFRLSYQNVVELLDAILATLGISIETPQYSGSAAVVEGQRTLQREIERSRQSLEDFFSRLDRFARANTDPWDKGALQLSIGENLRDTSSWAEIRGEAENARIGLSGVSQALSYLAQSLNNSKVPDLGLEATTQMERLNVVQDTFDQFFIRPLEKFVYWLSESPGGVISLNGAPLEVSTILSELLFSTKRSVILTSATLSTNGGFSQLKRSVGLEDPEEAILGSPFDYERAAMICLPMDMPEPRNDSYGPTVGWVVEELALSTGGATMALFTSYSALRQCAIHIRKKLQDAGIRVLAQGIDGSPRQLLEDYVNDPRAVLLGTASFWEGVDLIGGLLKVLVLPRLPFNVPTEPLFSARSALYSNPFVEYALPQAILRFRQGFGRLIRASTDKGAVVVLDSRISSRSYGPQFIDSLPSCTIAKMQLADLPDIVSDWIRD
jgi:predicted DnaQ family exonuclease/DinG family helicase